VDEIMSDTRMPGLSLEDRLQDGGSLELIGVSLVGRRGRDVQGMSTVSTHETDRVG
jgi:hypothetical protein